MSELDFRQATSATAAAAPTAADPKPPGKNTRASDLPATAKVSDSTISRVKAYAGETFGGPGGYTYQVQDDGSFKVLAGPTSVDQVFAPYGKQPQAWLNCAALVQKKPPVKSMKAAATDPTKLPAQDAGTGANANANANAIPEPSMLDTIHHALSRASNAIAGLFDFSDRADAAAPAVPEAETTDAVDPQFAKDSPIDGNLKVAKALADRLTKPHSYNADLSAKTKADDVHGQDRVSALMTGDDEQLSTIVCSEFTTLTLVNSGVDMAQRYRDPATGLNVGYLRDGKLQFATIYGVTNNWLWQTTAILDAQHNPVRVEAGSPQAQQLGSTETRPFLFATSSAVAVAVHAGDAFGAGAVAQSLGGRPIDANARRPGDLQQSLTTVGGKTIDGEGHVGAGHSSQVWAVQGSGVAYLGAAGSPTLHTTKATDIPPGWYALEGVAMELGPTTDPATVASIAITRVQLIDANVNYNPKADGTARGGDATAVGAMDKTKAYSESGSSSVVSAGRLSTSKWYDWNPTSQPVIGTITPDGIKPAP